MHRAHELALGNRGMFIIITVLKIMIFIYLFMAALDFCCCTRVFSSCGERGGGVSGVGGRAGLLFNAVRGLLIVVASLVAERGL